MFAPVLPRILLLNHGAALGGAELFLLTLAQVYRGGCHLVTSEAGPLTVQANDKGIPVETVAWGRQGEQKPRSASARLLAFAQAVWRVAHSARGAEVVVVNSAPALLLGVVAAWLARKPCVWYVHDIPPGHAAEAWTNWWRVYVANHFVARVLTNSEATRQAYAAAGGRVRLARVLYNGIDASATAEQDLARGQALRRTLGLEGKKLVGMFSRLAQWKGQHVLIDALAQMPGVHALIVGAALTEEEQGYERELRAQVASLRLEERVHFLGFLQEVAPAMQAVDVVVHASITPEPFGRVIVEGLLAGKPVVATRGGGVGEILRDGVCGRMVVPANAGALALAIEEILEEPLLAGRLGAQGQKLMEQQFSVRRLRDEVERLLGELRPSPAPAPRPAAFAT